MGLGAGLYLYTKDLSYTTWQRELYRGFRLFTVRFPRIIITLLLSRHGTCLIWRYFTRGTRNDLAEPGIIGINAGAGVAIAVIFFCFFP